MDNIERVAEFHKAFGQMDPVCPEFPPERTTLVRLQLISEELSELVHGLAARDMVECLDALCDLSYVVDGTWLALGLKGIRDAAMAEVHRSNMTKLGADGKPILNEAGRVVKGPNYRKADLRGVLEGYYELTGWARAD